MWGLYWTAIMKFGHWNVSLRSLLINYIEIAKFYLPGSHLALQSNRHLFAKNCPSTEHTGAMFLGQGHGGQSFLPSALLVKMTIKPNMKSWGMELIVKIFQKFKWALWNGVAQEKRIRAGSYFARVSDSEWVVSLFNVTTDVESYTETWHESEVSRHEIWSSTSWLINEALKNTCNAYSAIKLHPLLNEGIISSD